MRRGMYHTRDPVRSGAVIGQQTATPCVPWLTRQRVQRWWAGESTGGGGCTDVGLMYLICVSDISVGVALCVSQE